MRDKEKKMAEFPTQKQEDYAKKIANTLGLELPSMRTKQAYSHFISENVNAFKREQQRYHEMECLEWECTNPNN